jgi:hypothetical protein
MEICISTQGINLGGDIGLTTGINKKWNWRIKKKYYDCKNSNNFFWGRGRGIKFHSFCNKIENKDFFWIFLYIYGVSRNP